MDARASHRQITSRPQSSRLLNNAGPSLLEAPTAASAVQCGLTSRPKIHSSPSTFTAQVKRLITSLRATRWLPLTASLGSQGQTQTKRTLLLSLRSSTTASSSGQETRQRNLPHTPCNRSQRRSVLVRHQERRQQTCLPHQFSPLRLRGQRTRL